MLRLFFSLLFVFSLSNAEDLLDLNKLYINESAPMLQDISIRRMAGIVSKNDGVNIIVGQDVNSTVSFYMDKKIPKLLPAFRNVLSENGYSLQFKSGFYFVHHNLADEFRGYHTYTMRGDVYQSLKPMLKGLKHTYLPSTNKIVFDVDPDQYQAVQNVLSVVDIPRDVYNFKITIFDIDLDKLNQTGIDTAALGQIVTDNFNYFVSMVNMINLQSVPYASGDSKLSLYSALNYLDQHSIANIRTSTIINTLDGVESVIKNVHRVPYLKSTNTISDAKTQDTNSYDYMDIGLSLGLTPHYLTQRRVTLGFSLNYSLPVGTATSELLPKLSEKSFNNVIRLNKGQSIMVGGFRTVSQTGDQSKIPVLGDLPVLGNLFKTSSNNNNRRATYIIIEYLPGTLSGSYARRSYKKMSKKFNNTMSMF
ncbi:hypothetical protein YH65_11045 [Sulfurovum lithotrophicum]|uniref:Type II/III secretion system secretin-like domain-containing protein n=1 Tax=Sulfurovum lithotrophicum TaxID=206403 RepID=A0A7U4M2X0_9BACT|nr:hypothetical protein [Sulfurovum lithotrophicum]AKF25857.1 hypothetical protein YH65_11045 [Sulfurovum lithotrophicum]